MMTRNDRIRGPLSVLLALPVLAGAAAASPDAEQVRFFEAKVRPVLVDNCLKCHGPDKQKSGLRLDSLAATLAGGEQGPAVVPGKPDESLLVTAVRHEDDALKMPPSKKLAADQVADLTRWVVMGAPWPGSGEAGEAPPAPARTRKAGMVISDKDRAHWAFRPVTRPAVPVPRDDRWVRNPIDAFLLQGIEARGLRPNPPASKTELVRRAYYDLTGLPPTPAEAGSFASDPAPDAYERLVDRLLDSPRYGEKWARHWLDLVRFAETNSFERDGPKPSAWRYRDYVIRSLNADKPFDRFTREQLAGDEIAPGDSEALTATGYYRLGIWDDEPADREQARYDGFDDLVATTGQVFLGMTVDCARCHDHKIDPIPQKDYYKFVSFFRNVNHFRNGGPTDEVPLFDSPDSREAYAARLLDLRKLRDAVQAKAAAIEDEFLAKSVTSEADGVRRPDFFELRYRFYRDTFDRLPDFSALKYEDAGDLPAGLIDLKPRTRDDAFGFVFEGLLVVPEAGEYTFHLDSDDGSRLTVNETTVVEYDGTHRLGKERSATVELPRGRIPVRLEYFQQKDGLGLNLAWSGPDFARRSLSATGKERPGVDVSRAILARGAEVLGKERFAEYRRLSRRLRALAEAKPAVDTALCVTEAGPVAPETFVLVRGNPHVPGEKVEPGFLEVLGASVPAIFPPPPGAKSTGRRAALADWITSPANPLTPRVTANRVWQYHFGRGIVRSPSNFGRQGDRPTHPELLDWLAAEMLRQGWRLKPIHRLIVTSNTYKMSSRAAPEALAKDPTNDRLWRVDMRRLSAEEIRDSILAVGGTLNPKMYGPGIFPEIPREVLAGQSVPGAGWDSSPADEAARRSVYIHVKRSLLTPILESFDVAEADRSTPVRFATTQPTQALSMINGPFLGEQAARLAGRLRREAGADVAAQVALALRLATGRDPGAAEVARGVGLIAAFRAEDHADSETAMRAFCLAVLNLNEFIYLD